MTILAKEMLVKNMYQNPNKQKTANVFGITSSYLLETPIYLYSF